MSAAHRIDVWLRIAAESVFGPMYEWRLYRWCVRRSGRDPDDYLGIGTYRSANPRSTATKDSDAR
jgi:hypothetical protein